MLRWSDSDRAVRRKPFVVKRADLGSSERVVQPGPRLRSYIIAERNRFRPSEACGYASPKLRPTEKSLSLNG